MRNQTGCTKTFVGLILVLGMVTICAVLFWNYSSYRQKQLRVQFQPPQVLVSHPPAGRSLPVGSHELVSALSYGGKPIVRAELWVDGELKSSDTSAAPQGITTLYSTFDLVVPMGAHLLIVRGIDTEGRIGQSVPISIIGEAKPDKVFHSVPGNGGETLVIVPANQGPPTALSDDTPPSSAPVITPPTPPLAPAGPSLLMFDPSALFTWSRLPATPTNLEGQIENCNIKLRWNDNADNEERYDVWMTGLAGLPRVIASLKPGKGGAVWAELTVPEAGKLSIWVEAASAIGGQPSNIISLSVEPKCAPPPTRLRIQALKISASGGHDRTYCYVSLQGAPEIRIPGETNKFVEDVKYSVRGGELPIKEIVVPIPADGALDMSGECWGWAGNFLVKLGNFSQRFYADTWDGKEQELSGANFKIVLKIAGQSDPEGSRVVFTNGEDPNLPVPYDVKEYGIRGIGYVDPKLRSLHWKWSNKGDPNIKITSFGIYLNGRLIMNRIVTPAEQANPPLEWQEQVKLPRECDMSGVDPNWISRVRWQVVAVTAEAQSLLSAPYIYQQEYCPEYVRVSFSYANVYCSGKNIYGYFDLSVEGETREFWGSRGAGGGFYNWIYCGYRTYQYFRDMIGSWTPTAYGSMPQIFVVPIDLESNPNGFVNVAATIWNDDDDPVGRFKVRYSVGDPGYAKGTGFGCKGKDFTENGDRFDGVYTEFHINITVYPNECDMRPPSY